MIIAVDFDGTIVEHKYPKIGREIIFATDTLKALNKKGHQLILWSFRSGKLLDEAVTFCHKCKQVIDWWHNTLIERQVIQMYWADPPVTEQGSHNGLLSAGISTKQKTMQRRIAWMAQKYYKTYVTRWFK